MDDGRKGILINEIEFLLQAYGSYGHSIIITLGTSILQFVSFQKLIAWFDNV
jgi:hypothetical protein